MKQDTVVDQDIVLNQDTVLIVDDIEINRMILAEIFRKEFRILEAGNGKEALQILDEHYASIAIILLDIVMPEMNGYEVMEVLKDRNILLRIPVILITGEDSEDVEYNAYKSGVSDFIRKPFDSDLVRRRVLNTIDLYLYKNNLEMMVSNQTRKLKEQNTLLLAQAVKLQEMNDSIIDSMSNIVEFRNLESGQHVKRIKKFTRCLAECFQKVYPEYRLDDHKIQVIEQVSAMHDIGKISISDNILLKPGKLTNEEFQIMKTHTLKGCTILETMVDFQDQEYYDYSYDICRHHHERYDGRGYPDGLAGNDIPIAAQLVSIADVYDALVTERVYKAPFDKEVAFQMILDGKCGIFGPKLLDCFTKVKTQFEALAYHHKEELN
ncbi:response regulator [Lachnospiraceae bacterium ZAX-1]